jgi:hypothetical protein
MTASVSCSLAFPEACPAAIPSSRLPPWRPRLCPAISRLWSGTTIRFLNRPIRRPEIGRALAELARAGKLTGMNSEKISVRIDPGLRRAAAERLGLPEDQISQVINAALALAAAPDPFKT